jgi:hypothetical protein
MAMSLVETVTVPAGGSPSITFNNIPQTGLDLVVLANTRTNRTTVLFENLNIALSGSTQTGNGRFLQMSNTTISSAVDNNGSLRLGAQTASTVSNTFSNAMLYIHNYAGGTIRTAYSSDSVIGNNVTEGTLQIGGFRPEFNLSVQSLTLTPAGGFTLQQNSTISLYIIS